MATSLKFSEFQQGLKASTHQDLLSIPTIVELPNDIEDEPKEPQRQEARQDELVQRHTLNRAVLLDKLRGSKEIIKIQMCKHQAVKSLKLDVEDHIVEIRKKLNSFNRDLDRKQRANNILAFRAQKKLEVDQYKKFLRRKLCRHKKERTKEERQLRTQHRHRRSQSESVKNCVKKSVLASKKKTAKRYRVKSKRRLEHWREGKRQNESDLRHNALRIRDERYSILVKSFEHKVGNVVKVTDRMEDDTCRLQKDIEWKKKDVLGFLSKEKELIEKFRRVDAEARRVAEQYQRAFPGQKRRGMGKARSQLESAFRKRVEYCPLNLKSAMRYDSKDSYKDKVRQRTRDLISQKAFRSTASTKLTRKGPGSLSSSGINFFK